MLERAEIFENLILTNFGCLTTDVVFNERYKNVYDPVFLLFVVYAGIFSNKIENKLKSKISGIYNEK
jgi:hypothetical protein